MTFDETKSWYYEKNQDMMQRKSRGRMMGPNFKKKLMFHCNQWLFIAFSVLLRQTDSTVI